MLPLLYSTYAVSDGAQFVERLNVEPRAFISSSIQSHTHRILLQQSWQSLIHGQLLIALQVEPLHIYKYI